MTMPLRCVPTQAPRAASRHPTIIAKWEVAQHAGVLFAAEADIPMTEVEELLLVEPAFIYEEETVLSAVEGELDALIRRLQHAYIGWCRLENAHECDRATLAGHYWELFVDCRRRLLALAER